jgi:hypothetical protein
MKDVASDLNTGRLPDTESSAGRLCTLLDGSRSGTDGDTLSHGIFSEAWAARHNHDLWGTGPDGTNQWRNQADGFFE